MDRTVALFITCLTDQFYPRVGVAMTKVLEKLGWTVVFPAEQTCCGQPFFNNGYQSDAVVMAKQFVEIFEPYQCIVTPSASCCSMVREHFPKLLSVDAAWEARAQHVASNTFEFVEFLRRVEGFDATVLRLAEPLACTYHYSCHQRLLGMTSEGTNLLASIANVQFSPLEKPEQCCGFGGTFAMKYPQISGVMVRDKINDIRRSGASIVVSNDAGCSMNIAGACHRGAHPVQVKHIAELIAEAMGLATESL